MDKKITTLKKKISEKKFQKKIHKQKKNLLDSLSSSSSIERIFDLVINTMIGDENNLNL